MVQHLPEDLVVLLVHLQGDIQPVHLLLIAWDKITTLLIISHMPQNSSIFNDPGLPVLPTSHLDPPDHGQVTNALPWPCPHPTRSPRH